MACRFVKGQRGIVGGGSDGVVTHAGQFIVNVLRCPVTIILASTVTQTNVGVTILLALINDTNIMLCF